MRKGGIARLSGGIPLAVLIRSYPNSLPLPCAALPSIRRHPARRIPLEGRRCGRS
jgi:hypothetical protein